MTSAAPAGNKRRVPWPATRSRRSARRRSVRRALPCRTAHAGGRPARTGRDLAPGSHHRQPSRRPAPRENGPPDRFLISDPRGHRTGCAAPSWRRHRYPRPARRSDLYPDKRRLAPYRAPIDMHTRKAVGASIRDPCMRRAPSGRSTWPSGASAPLPGRHRSRTHGNAMAHVCSPSAGAIVRFGRDCGGLGAARHRTGTP